MWRAWILVAACSSSEPPRVSEVARERPAPSIDAGSAAFAIPDAGAVTLPIAWTACTADADCTIVSLGCCDATPVVRAHVVELRAALERSGRRYCPPKDACGPSKHGTWDGEPPAAAASARCPAGCDPADFPPTASFLVARSS